MLSIILLTLAVSVATAPLTVIAMRAQRRMADLQPRLAQLTTPEEKMALFKERGVSPLSGCLPVLVQAPVFIWMFRHVRHVAATGLKFGRIDLAQSGIAALSGGPASAVFLLALLAITIGATVLPTLKVKQPAAARVAPVLFGAWALGLPLAVGVYYATSSVLRAVLQWGVNRHLAA
jgi:YidC/Oxa1 family membrane protein insertase